MTLPAQLAIVAVTAVLVSVVGGALLALADDLTELKTICHCGRKATMNVRLGTDGKAVREGAQIEIGGNDRYVAMCRRHFKHALAD
jgi:thymidine kinase